MTRVKIFPEVVRLRNANKIVFSPGDTVKISDSSDSFQGKIKRSKSSYFELLRESIDEQQLVALFSKYTATPKDGYDEYYTDEDLNVVITEKSSTKADEEPSENKPYSSRRKNRKKR